MMNDYWGHSGGAGYDVWGFIFMLIVMALVVVGVIVVVRYLGRDVSSQKETETALELLKKRYAKGDIDKEEFEEKRKALSD